MTLSAGKPAAGELQGVSRSATASLGRPFPRRALAVGTRCLPRAGVVAYPDFRLVDHPEGYEVKGLAWPGREANYDSNSQVPTGRHNGRDLYYVFGRYPSKVTEMDEYPVTGLVLCHGSFLNATPDYVHRNKSFRASALMATSW